MKRIYNHIPDSSVKRHLDHQFGESRHMTVSELPPSTNNDPSSGQWILDQGELGSCGLNSSGNLIRQAMVKSGIAWLAAWLFSRLGVYYDVRAEMGTVKTDSGVENRNVMDVLRKHGYAPEELWPYDIKKFKQRPPAAYYAQCGGNLAIESLALNLTNLAELKTCLAQGFTFFFGFNVPDTFEGQDIASTGEMSLAEWKSKNIIGGHDVWCVGYDDAKESFLVANSWGTGWGANGFFWFPYAMMVNPKVTDSAWTIRKAD